MKTLGLLGGMSWESTLPYYRIINETVRERLGGLHSAKIVLYSVDFHAIERLQQTGDWAEAGHVLARAARLLEAAGADGLVLCTNTMHRVASAIDDGDDSAAAHRRSHGGSHPPRRPDDGGPARPPGLRWNRTSTGAG